MLHNQTFEKRYIRKDGSVIWACLTVSLVRNDSGVPLHFITTVEDITTKKLAEEKYSKAFHASPSPSPSPGRTTEQFSRSMRPLRSPSVTPARKWLAYHD